MSVETITTMRHHNKWSVNEVLTLQREYELLELSVDEIATRHKRSMRAILFKLQAEGFISSWEEARGFSSQAYQSQAYQSQAYQSQAYQSQAYEKNCITEDILTPSLTDSSEEEESIDIILNEKDKLNGLAERVSALENTINSLNLHVAKLFAQSATSQANALLV
jgi:hypothetical protein